MNLFLLEEIIKVVSTLVRKVVVSRDNDGEQRIEPEIVVDVPIPQSEILSYDHLVFNPLHHDANECRVRQHSRAIIIFGMP